jgi:hypothetical protein
LTGVLVGVVRDAQGAVVPNAVVRVTSPSLVSGTMDVTTNPRGQFRLRALAPGVYVLDVEAAGFATRREEGITIGAGQTIERIVVVGLATLNATVVVATAGSRLDARSSGFETRFGRDDLLAIPVRRYSMFDLIKASPGISPTSPSGADDRVSAFGSSTNENAFLLDGSNFTCPCSGNALAEPGIDTIQEIQVRSAGASAEFGNIQGAVFNVLTRGGGSRFHLDLSYYAQPAGLTSSPVILDCPDCYGGRSGYERGLHRDVTANAGGPILRDRLWFFAGAQYLRSEDSQPGTDPAYPRAVELKNLSWKLTWQAMRGLSVVHTFSDQSSVVPERPTLAQPFETTIRASTSVPTTTFAHVTHVLSPTTLWDARAGRMVFTQDTVPAAGNVDVANHVDRVTGLWSGGPQVVGNQIRVRTTGKATMTHVGSPLLGLDHEWKFGVQVEKGEHSVDNTTPTGVRYEDNNGQPFQAIYREPTLTGGAFVTTGLFVMDAITVGSRTTVNAGLRFDHTRAFSQDLHPRDASGRETGSVVPGAGPLYRWNVVSPRLGLTMKLTDDARTILRASYGRHHQGVLTAELQPFHPGVTPTITKAFETATGDYTRPVSTIDPGINLRLDPETRSPRTDQYSVSVERELRHGLTVATAYVHKDGRDFTGWIDTAGEYREETRTLSDGRTFPVFALVSPANDRRFLLTNPDGYELTYNGVVMSVDARGERGWRAFGSYTLSRTTGMVISSAVGAGGAQISSVTGPFVFGRDPNSLTNAHGLLPGDRPHMARVMGTVAVPKTGVVLGGNFQYYSGLPWASVTQVRLPQGDQRVLLEPRGSRRLPAQTLLDLRVSRPFRAAGGLRVELLADVLNVLNSTASEGLVAENLFSPNFGKANVFIDPRRVMAAIRVNWGQ